ncbi:hypothetical protein EJ08DRAFT_701292 [Tothia fuscella]|uniref:Uncharacterized protein n=1 Tax=Tothia fuscella TaxID=1048955 RepID=A0A9P4NIE4_9PEZI|nr:hypothetical protein EJ08DRAFT_701292 [Tothia fuscella]
MAFSFTSRRSSRISRGRFGGYAYLSRFKQQTMFDFVLALESRKQKVQYIAYDEWPLSIKSFPVLFRHCQPPPEIRPLSEKRKLAKSKYPLRFIAGKSRSQRSYGSDLHLKWANYLFSSYKDGTSTSLAAEAVEKLSKALIQGSRRQVQHENDTLLSSLAKPLVCDLFHSEPRNAIPTLAIQKVHSAYPYEIILDFAVPEAHEEKFFSRSQHTEWLSTTSSTPPNHYQFYRRKRIQPRDRHLSYIDEGTGRELWRHVFMYVRVQAEVTLTSGWITDWKNAVSLPREKRRVNFDVVSSLLPPGEYWRFREGGEWTGGREIGWKIAWIR